MKYVHTSYPLWLRVFACIAMALYILGIIFGILFPNWFTLLGVPVGLTMVWLTSIFSDQIDKKRMNIFELNKDADLDNG